MPSKPQWEETQQAVEKAQAQQEKAQVLQGRAQVLQERAQVLQEREQVLERKVSQNIHVSNTFIFEGNRMYYNTGNILFNISLVNVLHPCVYFISCNFFWRCENNAENAGACV